jgi:hypothetical protein
MNVRRDVELITRIDQALGDGDIRERAVRRDLRLVGGREPIVIVVLSAHLDTRVEIPVIA